MSNKSPQVDAYITKSAAFARPLLEKVRALFHRACPEIKETMKWSFPHFEHQGIVGSMAAFKQHMRFGFWKGSLMSDPHRLFDGLGDTSMSGIKATSLADLPDDKILLDYICEAVDLNEQGVKIPQKKKTPATKPVEVPDYFMAALRKNKKALATFEAFSPSHKREYVEWIVEAKQEATRAKRLATAVEWLAQGKSRHWKYQKC